MKKTVNMHGMQETKIILMVQIQAKKDQIAAIEETIKAGEAVMEKQQSDINATVTEREELLNSQKGFFTKRQEIADLIVNLDKEGKIVLAMDAIGFKENLELRVQPGRNLWSYDEAMKSMDKILALKEEGAGIFLGHDPDFFKTIRWAPEYYE